MLEAEEYLAALQSDADAFARIVASADLEAPVPDCPGWALRDLALHLGGVHRWARTSIVTAQSSTLPAGPTEQAALHSWFVEGAADLVATLRSTDPAAPVWAFGPPPHVASFWLRRQPHETAIHRRDAQRAVGMPDPLDPALALDGIDEVVAAIFPRQVRLERIPPLQAAVLLEVVGRTSFVLHGDGTGAAPAPDAAVRGTAEELLLVLWRRADVDTLEQTGDTDLLRRTFALALTP